MGILLQDTRNDMVRTCLPFMTSGKNLLARHSERMKRQGRQMRRWEANIGEETVLEFAKSQRVDRPGVRQVPEGIGEQRQMEETGCEIICGAPTTLAVKG